MNDMMLGVSILLALSSWWFVYKPSLLDKTRDELFDLRQEIRDYFLQSGRGLDHPLYVALRDLINGHLHYTESLTMSRFVFWVHWHGKHPQEAEQLRLKVEAPFQTDDRELAAFAMNVRLRAAGQMYGHMLANTVPGVIVLALVGAILVMAASRQSRPKIQKARRFADSRLKGGDPLARIFDRVSRITHWSPQMVMEECATAS
ncbi:MAG: hypothetical protein M0Z68_08385 [Gammaproteobacteria bacterium]|nr:hypothetical protein [Gammaproteobacteria bacterium]